jgi:hypothetical protein
MNPKPWKPTDHGTYLIIIICADQKQNKYRKKSLMENWKE